MNPADERLIERVAELYRWIDSEAAALPVAAPGCTACGRCCDFDRAGHRLYITEVERRYFIARMGPGVLRPLVDGRCPYLVDGRCSVYPVRFASCRIFQCRGDTEDQQRLTEAALVRLRAIGEELGIAYLYTDLAAALTRPHDHEVIDADP